MNTCEIVKDLLPLVAEDMASKESAAFVKEHLETCETCRAAFDAMQKPVETEPAAPLKSARKAVKRRGWLIAGLIACLVAALALGAFARLTKPIPLHSFEEAFEPASIELKLASLPAGPVQDGASIVLEKVETPASHDNDHPSFEDLRIVVSSAANNENPYEVHIVQNDSENAPINSAELIAEPEQYIPISMHLKAKPETENFLIEQVNGERFVSAYTSLWHRWFHTDHEELSISLALIGLDAVYFEPYNNTDHEILYQREGYQSEAGFALPRLVLNYYFAIAAIAAAILFVPWLILLLMKKKKARRIIGIFLLIPASFAVAFLAAGFPATTITPVQELAFVLVIALLLIGAGLCGRKLFEKE